MTIIASKIIASNWKMNLDRQSAEQLLVEMASCPVGDKVKRIVFPSFTLLDLARATREQIGLANHLALGGQDCHAAANGAHTGDVSAAMLIESGCQWVLVGHSERRQNHKESSATIAAKLEMAQAEGLSVMLCVGENLAERESGHAEATVTAMLSGSLPHKVDGAKLVIAYEPVWAIGTGMTATPENVMEMHQAIHKHLKNSGLNDVPVLYGGSVNPENANTLLALDQVDGVLVGGASLDAKSINAITLAAEI